MVPARRREEHASRRCVYGAMNETRETTWDNGAWIELPRLQRDMITDFVIVGAGVSGLSAAFVLAEAGISVVVIDAAGIGAGMTRRSTAHISVAVDGGWRKMVPHLGLRNASLLAREYRKGIDSICNLAASLPEGCDFGWVDGELLGTSQQREDLAEEYAAATAVDLPLRPVATSCVAEGLWSTRFLCQGRLHPLKYVQGIARQLMRRGIGIFQAELTGFYETAAGVELRLREGHVITAQRGAILAHNLALDIAYPSVTISRRRSYVIATEVVHSEIADAITWDLAHPYHYTRLVPCDGGRWVLLAGGADHPVARAADPEKQFDAVERWMRMRFPAAGPVQQRWFGDLKQTSDNLPLVGRLPSHEKVYVMDGDTGLGINHAMIGAHLIRDSLLNHPNELTALFSPARH